MLVGLDIRDILIIDRIELGFRPGLNVLTGETGAGKSILLDALGFVLGWRGRADLVRSGAAQGEVTALFQIAPDHPAHAVLAEAGLSADEGELVLRRVNTPEGRKAAYVNDRPASGTVLRGLSDVLVELHGQHDDRGLLNPSGHRALLDAFARNEAARGAVRAAWSAVSTARTSLAAAERALAEAQAEEEFLRHAVQEIDTLAPEPGEDAALDTARRRMQGAEKIREDILRAAAALSDREGAEGQMSDALRWLEAAEDRADIDLSAPLSALSRALTELGEAAAGVERIVEALDYDPLELERTEERLFALRALARKHDVQPDALADLGGTLRARLEALDRGAADIAAQRAQLAEAEAAYAEAAETLRGSRVTAAQALDAAMSEELAPLKMERARFTTTLSETDPGPQGIDAVAFEVATNPGAPAGPLNRIASGGELSRFLLALKVCLTAATEGVTMIFDEIDRGVGGATADAVGRRLRALAERGQVLVVTHSPQVAALGAHHWRVEKNVIGDTTLSQVRPLDAPAREDEIARMLSGDTVSEAARAAARALLKAG